MAALIARDLSVEPEASAIASVDGSGRYHRDLYALVKNIVAFWDFYIQKAKSVFQAGSFCLDGRACEL